MKIPQRLKCWLALFAFIISLFVIYERNNLQELITLSYPEQFSIPCIISLKQPDTITCGPTSAAMILQTYGKNINIDQIKQTAGTVWFQYQGQEVGMTTPDYLELALNEYLPSKLQPGTIDLLKYEISNNKPCIVLVRSGQLTWHYFVVIGYDVNSFQIINPSDGELKIIAKDIFLNCWSWKTDTCGRTCPQSCLLNLLKFARIYPYTIICPLQGVAREPKPELVSLPNVGS